MCTNFIWYKQLLYIFYPDSPLFSIFYVPFIILILSPLPTYTHTHTLFFFNSLIDEMRYVLLPLHSLFPRNKNILLCNHSTHTKFRTTLIAILSLIFVSCPNKYLFIAIFFSGKGSILTTMLFCSFGSFFLIPASILPFHFHTDPSSADYLKQSRQKLC